MNSKEMIEEISWIRPSSPHHQEMCEQIKQDLDRLKELEKENDKLKEVIKNLKSMDIKLEYHPKNIKHQYILRIKAFGKDLFFDLVNEMRYNLLKEVLRND